MEFSTKFCEDVIIYPRGFIMTNKELNNVVDNIDAMGSIASHIRCSDDIKKILKRLANGEITSKQAQQLVEKLKKHER